MEQVSQETMARVTQHNIETINRINMLCKELNPKATNLSVEVTNIGLRLVSWDNPANRYPFSAVEHDDIQFNIQLQYIEFAIEYALEIACTNLKLSV